MATFKPARIPEEDLQTRVFAASGDAIWATADFMLLYSPTIVGTLVLSLLLWRRQKQRKLAFPIVVAAVLGQMAVLRAAM